MPCGLHPGANSTTEPELCCSPPVSLLPRTRAHSQREERVTTEVLREGLQGGGLDVLTAYVE